MGNFEEAILIIRNPFEAILTEFHLEQQERIYGREGNQTDPKSLAASFQNLLQGNSSASSNSNFSGIQTYKSNPYWYHFSTQGIQHWERIINGWVNNFGRPIHIVCYNKLLADPTLEIKKILKFLASICEDFPVEFELNPGRFNCLEDELRIEGEILKPYTMDPNVVKIRNNTN